MNSDKKYIVILLATTLISAGTMIYFANTTYYYQYDYNFKVDENEANSFIDDKESIINYEEDLEDDSVQDVKESHNNTLKQEEIIEEVLDDSINDQYKEDSRQEENGSSYISNNNGDVADLEESESITVFKVDKNNIVSEIPNKDKVRLIKMANSLSIGDYKELLTHVKRSDELLAAIDIFELLKEKLSIDDYEELTKILMPYVDINMIENRINKK